jgi:peptidoglycan/LPS O-acetylase OafA/YrhL
MEIRFASWCLVVAITPLVIFVITVQSEMASVSRSFESKALRRVGRLSYSIYLWQQIFLARETSWVFQLFPG